MPHHYRITGFSLIETLIVVSIVGVLLGLAVPSFHDLIVERRVESSTQRISDVLGRAIDEARTRREAVTLSWAATAQGALTIASADREIHVEAQGDDSVSAGATTSVSKQIVFAYTGFPDDGGVSTFVICEPLNGSEKASRLITLGRASSIQVSNTSGAGAC